MEMVIGVRLLRVDRTKGRKGAHAGIRIKDASIEIPAGELVIPMISEVAGIQDEAGRECGLHLEIPLDHRGIPAIAREVAGSNRLIGSRSVKTVSRVAKTGEADGREAQPLCVVVAWSVEVPQLPLAFVETRSGANHGPALQYFRGPCHTQSRLKVLRARETERRSYRTESTAGSVVEREVATMHLVDS